MRRIALALLLSACIEEHHGPGVVGSATDVTTPPGDYVGYRVVRPCASTWTDVAVIGTGGVAVTETAAISAAGQELHDVVATDLASVWGWGGYGLVCDDGIGTQISLSDWRDVDTLIARVGDYLREHDYALQVGISVEGIPVPHVSD